MDQVADGIVMADGHGTLRLVNHAARDLGLRPGMPVEVLGDGGGNSPLGQALRGESSEAFLHLRDGDGKTRALAVSAAPLRRPDGTRRGAVAVLHDETERERRDLEEQQTAQFRERFIGILGHDLRAPLTAVVASASLIQRQRDISEVVRASAGLIGSTAHRMVRMIGDLLDFTQARLAGGLPLQREPCDLNDVAHAAVDETLAANPGRQIRVAQVGDTRGSFDADRAAQLLTNLLQNAVAYAPPLEPIDVEVRGLEGTVEISVSNAGPQLKDTGADLFEAFRRGSAAARNSKGLGLGLFIVREIARAHGGDTSVESGLRRTTFRAAFRRDAQR